MPAKTMATTMVVGVVTQVLVAVARAVVVEGEAAVIAELASQPNSKKCASLFTDN
jgi:hypothetical protein